MHIVCPHCTTSYAIDLATLGAAGRTVRCSRCKEVWLARPEDAIEIAARSPAMAAAGQADAEPTPPTNGTRMAPRGAGAQTRPSSTAPRSPPTGRPRTTPTRTDGRLDRRRPAHDADAMARRRQASRLAGLRGCCVAAALPADPRPAGRQPDRPPAPRWARWCWRWSIWRGDVVRLLPQTAAFYKMVGLEVNLRGLAFKDVKITDETVEGKPVLVIEGVIVGETRKPVELPRLRFSRARRAGRGNLCLERGAGAGGAEARRARLVQVAAGLAAAGRAQYRRSLLQQAGYRRRQCLNGRTVRTLEDMMPRCRAS